MLTIICIICRTLPVDESLKFLKQGQPDDEVMIRGWVRTKRELKEFTFLEVSDGSSLANLQVIISSDLINYAGYLKQLNTGASLSVSGKLVPSPGKGAARRTASINY